MIQIFYGEDSFSLKEALGEIEKGLGAGSALGADVTYLEGKTLAPEQLRQACQAFPFLGQRRLVKVEGLLSRFEGEAEERARPWFFLARAGDWMPESTNLVFVDGPLKQTNPLLRALAPVCRVRRFRLFGRQDLRRWLGERAAQEGVTISVRAAALLAEVVGSNLWALNNELEKLALYAHGRRIEERDVELLVTEAREYSVFSMTDALLEGRVGQALTLMHRLMGEGYYASRLLAMLARQLRFLLQAKELAGLSQAEMEERLGLHPFAVTKVVAQAERRPLEELQGMYAKLLEADLSIKRGQRSEELALELLFLDLSRRG